MKIRRGIGAALALAMSILPLAACGSGGDAPQEAHPSSIKIWYYEEPSSGQARGWLKAADIFTRQTGIKVDFEVKSFTQIAQNGSQFLNSDDAPDVMCWRQESGIVGLAERLWGPPASIG